MFQGGVPFLIQDMEEAEHGESSTEGNRPGLVSPSMWAPLVWKT